MRILLWHVHGSWTTAFVQGDHTFLLPRAVDRSPDGRGRAATWDWPDRAVEVPLEQLADTSIDAVILQRCRDVELCEQWLGGRRPGRDVPAVWLEHNAPQGRIDEMIHPVADRDDVVVVHVTQTNALYWQTGSTRTAVIEHGLIDPGYRFTGEIEAAAAVINEAARRNRVVGADLLPRFGDVGTVDLMGIDAGKLADQWGRPEWLRSFDDLRQSDLHEQLPRRRCYLHTFRWTSLGLALLEAMAVGMPVVALSTLEVPTAVPPGCGIVSNDLDVLTDATARFLSDPGTGAELGMAARAHVLDRYGLDRFLAEWNDLLEGL